ncbi:uncharacterized protein EV420DRAFT_1672302 [Desarmillaria tabescens]|uniref:Uncharacterized protein n=1 Tax=Armillaria tabescens TaxID=1929756 RepID=A0AA39MK24_ARMTA|nr:uncharacterized protein EV420DRAFT_1672302 [Desarmillaria tabescens]KAK0436325.1 hypothetical protein EV420DRAFT_1672302 [Desarmillaria tabescens]
MKRRLLSSPKLTGAILVGISDPEANNITKLNLHDLLPVGVGLVVVCTARRQSAKESLSPLQSPELSLTLELVSRTKAEMLYSSNTHLPGLQDACICNMCRDLLDLNTRKCVFRLVEPEAGIESVYDIMEMEDDKHLVLLQLSHAQTQDVATFVNSYARRSMFVGGDYTAGAPIILQVALTRDIDKDDEEGDQTVIALFYPGPSSSLV